MCTPLLHITLEHSSTLTWLSANATKIKQPCFTCERTLAVVVVYEWYTFLRHCAWLGMPSETSGAHLGIWALWTMKIKPDDHSFRGLLGAKWSGLAISLLTSRPSIAIMYLTSSTLILIALILDILVYTFL